VSERRGYTVIGFCNDSTAYVFGVYEWKTVQHREGCIDQDYLISCKFNVTYFFNLKLSKK
jgi:hypothetical protein